MEMSGRNTYWREKLARAFCFLWLAVATPAYGVLPLIVILDANYSEGLSIPFFLYRLEGDLLRLAYSMFFGDPAPDATHVSHYNMLTDDQTAALVCFVFIIAAMATRYLYRTFRVRAV